MYARGGRLNHLPRCLNAIFLVQKKKNVQEGNLCLGWEILRHHTVCMEHYVSTCLLWTRKDLLLENITTDDVLLVSVQWALCYLLCTCCIDDPYQHVSNSQPPECEVHYYCICTTIGSYTLPHPLHITAARNSLNTVSTGVQLYYVMCLYNVQYIYS